MTANRQIAALAVSFAALLAGCGSSDSKHATSVGTNGEAGKPAAQIFSDAQAALGRAHGWRVAGSVTVDGKPARIAITEDAKTTFEVTFVVGPSSIDIRRTGHAFYLRASAAYWQAQHTAGAVRLANRWVAIPASSANGITAGLDPSATAHCLDDPHGTLSVAGTTTVDGRPAVVVKDAGNVPGSGRAEFDVATTGAPYPLRAIAIGPEKPGGRKDMCNDGGDNDQTIGTLTLSDFNHPPRITAPATTVPLPAAGQAS
jgi:hypothetical protein